MAQIEFRENKNQSMFCPEKYLKMSCFQEVYRLLWRND